MNTFFVSGVPGQPGFFRRKADERCQPGSQTIEDFIQHGARAATCCRCGTVAIQAILAYIKVESGQVNGAEIMDFREQRMEVEIIAGLADHLIHFP